MDRHRTIALFAGLSLLLAACSGSGSGSPSASGPTGAASPIATPAPTLSPTPLSTTAATPAATETTQPTGVPTTLDPCQVVTAAEASSLTGATFAAGQASTTEGNGKLCSYALEGVVFEVALGVAPDEATAKSGEAAFRAEIEKNAGIAGSKLTELPGFENGVDAAIEQGQATISGLTIKVIAMYLLKGTTFLGISDISTLGAAVPTAAAMEAQAHTSLARLP
ncbi:MAG: hypothetical protein EPN50_09535 [Chloroflexota bacterium]|nr:MAG: hypothetical protein EPN50_09535 [Chloroflexota bacterium]